MTAIMPTWDQLRRKVNDVALERGEYAGYPLPVEGYELVVQRRFPLRQSLEAAWRAEAEKDSGLEKHETLRNTWYSTAKQEMVYIVWRHEPGHPEFKAIPVVPPWGWLSTAIKRLNMTVDTACVASQAWSVETELNAQKKLFDLIGEHQRKMYVLTGSFGETSKRSGVSYIFRRLRPTLAIKQGGGLAGFLAALCMHPIAYYNKTWAGSMTPTDDVIAHLMLMRGDEHLLWRRCNQHPLWVVENGL